MKKKFYLFLVLACFISKSSYSQSANFDQNLPKVVTPEVATLMKYINHPVDLAHGLVKIEIPIYVLEFDGAQIPISISYHSSGFKVKETNGRLGIGWSLDCSPSISRSINGLPDENGYLRNPGSASWSKVTYEFYKRVAQGVYEEDPDTYYYKLLNKSGKFYLDRGSLSTPALKPTPTTVPFEPIKIEYLYGNKFQVWDDDGFHYDFNGTATGLNDGNSTVHWKVNTVTSPNKRNLRFNYFETPMRNIVSSWNLADYIAIEELNTYPIWAYPYAQMASCSNVSWPLIITSQDSYPKKVNSINVNTDASGKRIGTIGSSISCDHLDVSSPGSATQTLISKHVLESFETDGIKVEMVYNYTKDQLNGVNIIDKSTNEIIRSARFTLSKYNPSSPDRYYQKIKMDKMEILDKNGNIIEKYVFDYYNPTSTPNIMDKNTDHWGYYNGPHISESQISVPRQEVKFNSELASAQMQIGEAVKEPNFLYTRTGVLQSITYPTGRKSTFFYELNRHEPRQGENVEIGGLRIQRIEEYDPVTLKTFTRLFEYKRPYVHYPITLDSYKYKRNICTGYPQTGKGWFSSTITYYTSNAFPNLFNDGSSTVTYGLVSETRLSNEIEPMGRTVYEYTSDYSYCHHIPNTTIVFNVGAPWNGNKLMRKTDYKAVKNDNDFTYEPVREESYTYNGYSNSVGVLAGKTYRNFIVRNPSTSDTYGGEFFDPYNEFRREVRTIEVGANRLVSEIVCEIIDGVKSYVREKKYQYNNRDHLYLTDITETNSNSVTRVTSIKYPQDLTYPNGSEEEKTRLKLIENNQLNIPLVQTKTVNNVVWKDEVRYKINTHTSTPLPESYLSGPAEDVREKVAINEYYSSGKPASSIIDGSEQTVYLWGYCGNYLIAEIKNATLAQVTELISRSAIESISSKILPSASDLNRINSLRQQLKGSHITTYTYKMTGEPLTITNASGVPTIYDYDTAGRLKEVYYYENSDLSKKMVVDTYDYHYRNN